MTANTPSLNDTATHKAQLLAYLMKGQTITALQALIFINAFHVLKDWVIYAEMKAYLSKANLSPRQQASE